MNNRNLHPDGNKKRKKVHLQFTRKHELYDREPRVRKDEDVEYSEVFDAISTSSEWEKNKYLFAFSYFFFFLPLFRGYSPRDRFYVNQGLMVWIWLLFGNVVLYFLGMIPTIAVLTTVMQWLFSTYIVGLAFYGFIKTLQNSREVKLPVIGQRKIIR